jgi:hypothetical protein
LAYLIASWYAWYELYPIVDISILLSAGGHDKKLAIPLPGGGILYSSVIYMTESQKSKVYAQNPVSTAIISIVRNIRKKATIALTRAIFVISLALAKKLTIMIAKAVTIRITITENIPIASALIED